MRRQLVSSFVTVGKILLNCAQFGLVAAMLTACSADGNGMHDMSKSDAIQAARKYIADRMPDFAFVNAQNYDGYAVDEGASWGVAFMPHGVSSTGGTPEFTIDKKTLHIVDVRMSQ